MTSPPATGRPARLLGGVWALIVTVLTLLGLLAFGTGTAPAALPEAQTRVGVSAPKTITVVWVSEYIASGQGRGLPVLQGLFVVATGVAANAAVPRFLGNEAGDILDSTRVTIPEGKFGYLLKNPSKSGVFRDSMGFDEAGLDSALRNHLTTNFGNASEAVPMTGGGSKFVVRGPMTGPSGQTWNINTAWGVDLNGTVRLITATP